jgi:hypothetical protein
MAHKKRHRRKTHKAKQQHNMRIHTQTTQALPQTTGGKDEPRIVFMRKS